MLPCTQIFWSECSRSCLFRAGRKWSLFIVHQHSVLWNRANLSARVAHIGTSSQTSVSACQKSRLLSSRFLRVQSDAVLVRIDHSVEVIRRRVHWAGGLSDLSAQKPVCVRTGRIL